MTHNIDTGAYPHPVVRVEAKLYKEWWSTIVPDYVVEVPARAFIENGKEVVAKTAFHQWIVFEGELYKAREICPGEVRCANEYEWENTVFMKCDDYAVLNDISRARSESTLMNTLSKLSVEEIEELSQTITAHLKERERTI